MPIVNTSITQATPLTELISYAQSEIHNLFSGEEFLVKYLFLGYEWNRIPPGIRTKLGGMFFAYAKGEGSVILDILGKTPQNQQRYRKK